MMKFIPIICLGFAIANILGATHSPQNAPKNTSIPSSAKQLFATKQSLGSISVGHAEGNMDVRGNSTKLTDGHIDPGNGAFNRGFCSWNKANGLSVAQADEKCLRTLQQQAATAERDLKKAGIEVSATSIINGADLANQSPRAGADFGARYAQALDKNLKGEKALIDARVESFRTEKGILSASGLFHICNNYASYRKQLAGLKPYSESWRWQCIALDQRRRVRAINEVLETNQ
ncbi:MAG: hypothetical protein IE914_04540 [Thiotrichales bacterium]|nr:hypothetical protein [Thiotrichales bacterium]